MRINLVLTVILLISQFSFSQNDLNTRLNHFAKEYVLYNMRLNRLETTSSIERRSRLLEKWNEMSSKDSFCLQNDFKDYQLLRSQCNNAYYKNSLGVRGYPLSYLYAITDRYQEDGKLSETNAALLKNILNVQIDNQELIKRDAEFIDSVYTQHFGQAPISKLKMEQIVDFVLGDTKNIQEAKSRISSFSEQNFKDLKQFFRDKGINYSDVLLSVYRTQDKRRNYFTSWSDDRLNPLNNVFLTTVAIDFCEPYSLNTWKIVNLDSLNYIKYAAFFENSTIFNVTVLKYLFDEWDKYESQKFKESGTNQYLMSKGLLSDIQKMLPTIERYFPSYQFKKDYQLGSKSKFEQLFIAAFNDVYFELGVRRWRGEPDGEIDVSSFDLSNEQLKIVDAILNMSEASTKSELQRLLMDRNFKDFETEHSFRLACYLAFHQKHEKMNRDWNHSEFYTNPFVSKKKHESFPILAMGVEELAKCKQVMEKVVQTVDKDGGRYCFTSYGMYRKSLFPNHGEIYNLSIFQNISGLNVADMNSDFIRCVTNVKPVKGSNQDASSESILVPLSPSPPAGPPAIVFRERPKLEESLIDEADLPAKFPGGEAALHVWLNNNIRYPGISRELGDQGRIYVKFAVEVDGTLSKIQVMRGGVTPELNREAIRLVRAMPKWIPGELNGKKVRTESILPIVFALN